MIAVDASFLLEFLQIYVVKQGRKSAHNAILRDVVMLENQIPLFSIRKNLEFQLSSLEEADRPLVFTRYTELMNRIINTEDDAKFLREHGVISNQLKSDEEVANLWNDMSKSIRLTKVSFLDKVIEDVNKNYNGRWKVKVDNLMKHVPGSWQSLTLVAVILILLLMILQAFCSVYNCARCRRSHAKTIE
ncbi:UPF0481 At3g02645 [Olea europaea subsp. europaea]|uniref:UPF0481 At3g02645 n=1 Tax=Olea europaea subsp. europaea TaxID=158383 RepID=A0A8S0SSQ4_OLEEU|nr:UPF0481 At3g02645 [Olea europaea subsp. europaea]